MSVKEAKLVKNLVHDESVSVEIKDSAFFKYVIQNTKDLEKLFLLLNVSNRKRVQIYVHKKNYPSVEIDEHEFAVGNIPDEILKRMFKMYYMKEMYSEANPFQYVEQLDTVIYYNHYRHTNPELFKPDNREKLDAERL